MDADADHPRREVVAALHGVAGVGFLQVAAEDDETARLGLGFPFRQPGRQGGKLDRLGRGSSIRRGGGGGGRLGRGGKRTLELLRPGGLVCVDNVLWSGKVVDPAVSDADTLAIRAFNEKLADDARISLSLLSIADGLTLARKR